jgi:hypothetical protein
MKKQISKTVKDNVSKLTKEERSIKFGNDAMAGKQHTEETREKMREKALGRVISESQKQSASNKLSIPIIATNLKTGEKTEYKSQKEAKQQLGLNGILHVLKGRTKQCGGYFFEYKNII